MEIDFRYPARLDDLVRIESKIISAGNASFTMQQRLFRSQDNRLLTEGKVTLVCVDIAMKPKRLPARLKELAQSE
jgi:acyl-CoA thioester hydrolase